MLFETAKGILSSLKTDMELWKGRCEDGSILPWRPVMMTPTYKQIIITIDRLDRALKILQSTTIPNELIEGALARRKIRYLGTRKERYRRHYLMACIGMLEAMMLDRKLKDFTEFADALEKTIDILNAVTFPKGYKI